MAGVIEIVSATDSARWDAIAEDAVIDPHCLRQFAGAHGGDLATPALLHAGGAGWEVLQVLLLIRIGPERRTARAPIYGGPWLRTDPGIDAPAAAAEARAEIDGALRALGIVSEVSVLSPWLPHPTSVHRAWGARTAKAICTAKLDDPEARWAALAPDRRAEVRRALREGTVRWRSFDAEQAYRFAAVYATAMATLDAAPHWRLGEDYFGRLSAQAGPFLRLSTVEGPGGGAAALCLRNARRASYLFAARWGRLPGAASAALWHAQLEFGRAGVEEMLLGGGISDLPDNSLLRFKRAFADSELDLFVAARTFDRKAHEGAVASGLARPLPDFTVEI